MPIPFFLSSNQRRRGRSGVAALEFGLLAPVLIPLVLATATLGLALRAKMQLGNAGRAGAAWVGLNGYDPASASNQTDLTNAVTSATTITGITVTASKQTQQCLDPSSPPPNNYAFQAPSSGRCPNNGVPGDYVVISLSLPYSYITPVPFTSISGTKTMTSVQLVRVK